MNPERKIFDTERGTDSKEIEESGFRAKAELNIDESKADESEFETSKRLGEIIDRLEELHEAHDVAEPGSLERMRLAMKMRELRREGNALIQDLPESSELIDRYRARIKAIEINKEQSADGRDLSEHEQKVMERGIKDVKERNPQGNNNSFWRRIKKWSE